MLHSIVVQNCESVAGVSIVSLAPGAHCDAAQYLSWRAFIIVVLVVDIAIAPLALLAFLLFSRNKIEQKEPNFTSIYGIFFELFAESNVGIRASWECVVLVRRAIISAITVVFSDAFRFMAYSIATIAFLLLHVFIRPYRDTFLNRLETCSLVLHLLVSVILTGTAANVTTAAQVIVSLLIVIPACVFLLLVAWSILQKRLAQSRAAKTDPDTTKADIQLSYVNASASPAAATAIVGSSPTSGETVVISPQEQEQSTSPQPLSQQPSPNAAASQSQAQTQAQLQSDASASVSAQP